MIRSFFRARLLGLALLAVSSHVAAQTTTPAFADSLAQRVKACVACHGAEGRSTSDGFYPRIAGKPAGYLYNQLINFRQAKRTYPMMTYMVSHMSDAYLQEIANYFSEQNPPYAAPQANSVPAAVLERGKALVLKGETSKDLPACVSCHGDKMTGVAPFIPGLLGLPRDYLVSQLGAWQTGSRHAAAPDCMQSVAKKLSAEDISAVASWLALQNMPSDSKAVSKSNANDAASFKLPLSCGSVPR
ncbi:c-type cytochrome [Undibacterium sp. LX40W]|uniref:C-type cytochrome n=1 Tax=Undibacterium nitidum TaxID=2762298 RepID=A0A923HLN0_9BURK|nr:MULTISPECIES: c-type cytochrome [Undibacterium]MBC3880648.1 c-type cytochrome [Undibacterium nitidum]MBC3890616.1 c-type cytochrome [Undibacterium sp. LX40W]